MSWRRYATNARVVSKALALALLSGPWNAKEMSARAKRCLGVVRDVRVNRVVRLALRSYAEAPLGREDELACVIARAGVRISPAQRARQPYRPLRVRQWILPEPVMAKPRIGREVFGLPELASEGALVRFLHLMPEDLDWFADLKNLQADSHVVEPLRHYRYRWLRKRSGSYRLIEAPKARLKRMQRALLDEILSKVPLHDACHGHRRDRSVRSFVAPHAGQEVVIRLDLEEFFSSIQRAKVRATFATLGYPDRVAARLAGLCCVATPVDILAGRPLSPAPSSGEINERFMQRKRLSSPHLPQGAPTSPALANLAAYRLDARLSGLARSYGAVYGRYADDLAISGSRELARAAWNLIATIGGIALEEGFRVRFTKTRIMTSSQRQILCGVVVNHAPSIPRSELERLEATLFNCIRHGVATQNRAEHPDFQAHLRGRIAWVKQLHAKKGAKLEALFSRIIWE